MVRRISKWIAIVAFVLITNVASLAVSLAFDGVNAFLSGLLDGVAPSVRTTMKADNDDQRRRNVELDKQLKTAQIDLEDKNRRLARLSARVIHQAGRIVRRMGVNATRNVGSMVAEATPVIGTFAIVGVTTLEVIDACLTIEDVVDLARLAGADGTAVDLPEAVCGHVTDGPEAAMDYLWSRFTEPDAPRKNRTRCSP
jgi:hypothetical protein